MKAAVPTLDSNSPVDMSNRQSLMMVDVYVAISANLARSAALLRFRPVVEAGISNRLPWQYSVSQIVISLLVYCHRNWYRLGLEA